MTFYSKGNYRVFAGENMTLFVGEGPLNKDGARNPGAKGLLISEATVGLVKQGEGDAAKYALSAEGQVSVVGISGLSLSGPISISYNGFDQLIDEAVAIAGTTKRVAVKYTDAQVSKVVNGVKESFYEIKGFDTPIAIDVAGQRVTANFSVRRFASAGSDKDDSLEFGLTNVKASFGDGASDFVTLSGGSGTLLSMPDGVALEASGTVSMKIPEADQDPPFSLSGTMDLKINNVGVAVNQGNVNLEAGPYTKFEGTGLELKVADQTIEGDFIFEKDANGDVRGSVSNGAIIISDSSSIPNPLISLSGISGGFEMSSEGSYGALQVGGSTFTVPGVSLSGGTVTVQMNTVDEEKSGDFNLGSGVETLTFGAGPYLRVDVEERV